jgi:G3E family GTPase
MSRQDNIRTGVAVLTGFLGSGKTTLLSQVLSEPGMQRVAVIINEFGAVSIDHRLVARSVDNIIELRNGCVCCTIRGDLVMTLRDLHERRLLGEIAPFDYVIIETTGLADPVPLLHTLIANPPVRQHYYPDVVIACADAEHLETTLADHDCGASQIAIADVVLVTKGDRVARSALDAVRDRVAELNPGAEILAIEHGRIEADRLFRRSLFEPRNDRTAAFRWLVPASREPSPAHHGSTYRSHVLTSDGPISLAGASVLLNHLVNRERDQILRIKGILRTRERPCQSAVVHAVRDKFYPIQWLDVGPDSGQPTQLVVIGRSLDMNWLQQAFRDNCVH